MAVVKSSNAKMTIERRTKAGQVGVSCCRVMGLNIHWLGQVQFDAAIVTVIVAIISPKCQAGNSKVLIGTCHTLKLYAATERADTVGGFTSNQPSEGQ